MRKLIVFGLGKKIGPEKDFNYVVVKKDKDFFKWLTILLEEFGYCQTDTEYTMRGKGKNVHYLKKNISKFVDKHEIYEGEATARIDVFYGLKKVFIVIKTTEISKLMKVLNKISYFRK